MVEGGGTIHTQLLEAGLADELQLVVTPLLVGQPDAVRMLGSASYPGGPTSRDRPYGQHADRNWLALVCEPASLCPPSETAFSVGAVVVAADGTELARGYSRESNPTTTRNKEPSPSSQLVTPGAAAPRSTAPWSPAPNELPAPAPAPSSSRTPASTASSPHGASPTPSSRLRRAPRSWKPPA